MAVIEEGLYSYLTTYAGLTALISTRVYAFRIPQGGTLPCLTFQRISTQRTHSHDTSGTGNDLARPRFQFDAWATTYASAKAINDQLRAALNGRKGTTGTVEVLGALVEDEQPTFDPDANLYRCRSDYFVWHND